MTNQSLVRGHKRKKKKKGRRREEEEEEGGRGGQTGLVPFKKMEITFSK